MTPPLRPALAIVPGTFAIHRWEPSAPIPAELQTIEPCWIARTRDELSIVCPESVGVEAPRSDAGWACLRVAGRLEFSLTGILAGIAGALADAGISLFAISTFDTDYVLVKSDQLPRAVDALRGACYPVDGIG